MHVANLWLFFYESSGVTPPVTAVAVTTQIAIDQAAEPEHELALAGGLLLGDS